MKELYNRILRQLDELRAQPIPRWVFLVQRIGVWVALFLSILLGALSLAYLVYVAQEADMLAVTGADPFAPLFTLLPVWVMSFLLFIGLTLWTVEQTERGYKVPLSVWVLVNVTVTCLGALLLMAFRVPAALDPVVERHLEPFSATGIARPLWQRPGQGRLQGKVLSVEEDALLVEDVSGQEWRIEIGERTRVRVPLEENRHVGILGKPRGEFLLEAMEILPLMRPLDARPNTREMRGLVPRGGR